MLRTLSVSLLLASTSAQAASLGCYEDGNTNAMLCYDKTSVREAGGIRSAALYKGGPKAVRATGYTLAINCATGVVHLKDRDGVSFAGSQTGTEAMRHLKAYICEAPIARR